VLSTPCWVPSPTLTFAISPLLRSSASNSTAHCITIRTRTVCEANTDIMKLLCIVKLARTSCAGDKILFWYRLRAFKIWPNAKSSRQERALIKHKRFSKSTTDITSTASTYLIRKRNKQLFTLAGVDEDFFMPLLVTSALFSETFNFAFGTAVLTPRRLLLLLLLPCVVLELML
jgi:hypothetical protein